MAGSGVFYSRVFDALLSGVRKPATVLTVVVSVAACTAVDALSADAVPSASVINGAGSLDAATIEKLDDLVTDLSVLSAGSELSYGDFKDAFETAGLPLNGDSISIGEIRQQPLTGDVVIPVVVVDLGAVAPDALPAGSNVAIAFRSEPLDAVTVDGELAPLGMSQGDFNTRWMIDGTEIDGVEEDLGMVAIFTSEFLVSPVASGPEFTVDVPGAGQVLGERHQGNAAGPTR